MDSELKTSEAVFQEPVITASAGKNKNDKKVKIKKHIDEYFDKEFLDSYFLIEKKGKKNKKK